MLKKILKSKWGKIVIVLAIIAAAFFWNRSRNNKEDSLSTTVENGVVSETLILSGEIAAEKRASLRFETAGKIKVISVSEGESVIKGQHLAQLDTSNINSDFQRAKSDLRDKEAILLRVYDDVKDSASDETFLEKEARTTAEVAKDKAYEAFLKAERDLKGASIYAPFDGIITNITSIAGAFALSTEPQIEIVNPTSISFELTADQTEVIDIKIGQKILITLDSFPDKNINGKVSVISLTPKASEVSTVYSVSVDFENATPDGVRVGMTGEASFVLSETTAVLWVPPRYIKFNKDGKYLKTNEKNSKVYVEVGIEGEDRVEISGDIAEGDTVYD